MISISLKKSRGKCTRPWSWPLCSIAAKVSPFEKVCVSNFGASTTACPQYLSHQHRSHYPQQHHFRKPHSSFGHLGSRQLLTQPSPQKGWPRRTHAHEPGAAAATHRLGGAPTADWIPRDEFRPHAQESAETQRPPHRLRNVERHRPRQAKPSSCLLTKLPKVIFPWG